MSALLIIELAIRRSVYITPFENSGKLLFHGISKFFLCR
jgi:hypothetical protein